MSPIADNRPGRPTVLARDLSGAEVDAFYQFMDDALTGVDKNTTLRLTFTADPEARHGVRVRAALMPSREE